MAQQFNPQNVKTKTALLVFIKGSVAPVVLYLDDPIKVYENIQALIQSSKAPRVFEVEANGPIKKVTFVTSDVTGCALQEEIHVGK